MNQFERDLRELLRRRPAPSGFAERVMSRVAESEERRRRGFFRLRSWQWAAAAAMVVVMIGAGTLYRDHRRQVEGEMAKEQLMLAMRITGEKLQLVKARLSQTEQKTIDLPLGQ